MRFLRLIWLLVVWLISGLAATAQQFEWAKPLQRMPSPGALTTYPRPHLPRLSATDALGNTYVAGSFTSSLTLGGMTVAAQGSGQNLFVAKLDAAGNLAWITPGHAYNSAVGATALALTLDGAGNPVLAARAYDSLIVGTTRQAGSHYLVSLSPAGTTRWIRPIQTYSTTAALPRLDVYELKTSAQGDFYALCKGTELDSIGGFHSGSHTDTTLYTTLTVLRFSPNGVAQWSSELESHGPDQYLRGFSIQPDGAGSCYVTGNFNGTLCYQGAGGPLSECLLGLNPAPFAFLIKLDNIGVGLWSTQVGNDVDGANGRALAVDAAGDVYWAGDAPRGLGIDTLSTVTDGFYVVKYSSNGQVRWLRSLDWGHWLNSAVDVVADPQGGISVLGTYLDSGRIDQHLLLQADSADLFVINFDAAGAVRWTATGGGADHDLAYHLSRDGQGNLYIYGQTQSATGFGGYPLQAAGAAGSAFLAKLRAPGNAGRLTGSIYLDANANGQRDASELLFPRLLELTETVSSQPHIVQGAYELLLNTGQYDLRLLSVPLHYTLTQGSGGYQGQIAQVGQTDTARHFGLAPLANQPDVRVTLLALHPPRPGFVNRYRATIENVGTTTLSGSAAVTLDPALTYLSAAPAATVTGQLLSWPYQQLAPLERRSFDAFVRVAPTVPLGAALSSTAQVGPLAGDLAPLDNVDTLRQIAIGSYDPNDISVDHEELTLGQVQAGQPLTYTIRFQNLGTATALTVVIRDTLFARYLNPATLSLVAASHSCGFQLNAAGLLTVNFPGIQLPHAAVDSLGSMGFVRFRVTPLTTLVVGDVIPDRAHITFDFNPPVATNTALTIITGATGLTGTPAGPAWHLYPNPATAGVSVATELATAGQVQLDVLNPLGRVVRQQRVADAPAGAFRQLLDLTGVAPGLYSVRLQLPDGVVQTRRLVRQ